MDKIIEILEMINCRLKKVELVIDNNTLFNPELIDTKDGTNEIQKLIEEVKNEIQKSE